MRLFTFLTFLARKIRHPQFADFLSQGEGISERYRRAEADWDEHLENSKGFQREIFLEHKPTLSSLCVLGAGRLLDFDSDTALMCFQEISLYDADPGSIPSWRNFEQQALTANTKVDYHMFDLTGRLGKWTSDLSNYFRESHRISDHDLANFLRRYEFIDTNVLSGRQYSVVLSLNILSQIPLFFRDRLYHLASRHAKQLLIDDDFSSSILDSLHTLYSVLQTQHLDQLRSLGAKLIVIITDTEYRYYRTADNALQVEPALYMPQPVTMSGYTLAKKKNWLWHIAPEGIEAKDYGILHPVDAYCFTQQ